MRVYTCDGPDTTPPGAPTIKNPANNSYDSDGIITLSGTAEAKSTVEILENGASVKTTQAGPGGAWSATLGPAPDGSHTYTARATDSANNTSGPSNAVTVKVDTVPPSVTTLSPADGAQNAAVGTNVEATFSEAMDQSTLTTSTFTLTEQGSGTPVSAAVSYAPATNKATLDPFSDLAPNASYSATIAGGNAGVKDPAGNAPAQDYSWTFTTTDTTPPERPSTLVHRAP